MSDIFLSYAHEDRDRAEKLAKALEGQGWTVFWDRTILAGTTWRETINKALEDAHCVVVVWSKNSIDSHWVKEEAEEGQERKILVPVLLDAVKLPLGFRSIQTANLADWDGDASSDAFRRLVYSIEHVIGPPKVSPKPPPSVREAEAAADSKKPEISKPPANADVIGPPEVPAKPPPAVREAESTARPQKQKNSQQPVNKRRLFMWLALSVALAMAVILGWRIVVEQRKSGEVPAQTQRQVEEEKTQTEAEARVKADAETKRLQEEKVKPEEEAKARAEAKRQAEESAKPLSVFQDTLKDGTLGPEMVRIPPGEFRMGDIQGSGDTSERPVHQVRISKAFAIGRYEVTFDVYDRFTQAAHREKIEDGGWGRGRRPVINVSWEDAVAYAQWLSEQTGKHYRLPTEAEWEHAARAGTETDYWWGNEIGKIHANCDGCGSQWDNKKTAPVGSFQPNLWGLYDTAGNVWEWVQECWHDNYEGAPADGSAWQKGDCGRRVGRGGSWGYRPDTLRSANRGGYNPVYRHNNLGFRLAQDE